MTLILFAKLLHKKMLDFLTERYKRSSKLNQNVQFYMPTHVTKTEILTSLRNLLAGQKKLQKRRKEARDRDLKNPIMSLQKWE